MISGIAWIAITPFVVYLGFIGFAVWRGHKRQDRLVEECRKERGR